MLAIWHTTDPFPTYAQTRFFEKLILLRIHQLEEKLKISSTGKSQHGFKHKHSITTAYIHFRLDLLMIKTLP